jgi:hypothetical protein
LPHLAGPFLARSPSPWPASTPPDCGNVTVTSSSSSWTSSRNRRRQALRVFVHTVDVYNPATSFFFVSSSSSAASSSSSTTPG